MPVGAAWPGTRATGRQRHLAFCPVASWVKQTQACGRLKRAPREGRRISLVVIMPLDHASILVSCSSQYAQQYSKLACALRPRCRSVSKGSKQTGCFARTSNSTLQSRELQLAAYSRGGTSDRRAHSGKRRRRSGNTAVDSQRSRCGPPPPSHTESASSCPPRHGSASYSAQ